MLNISKVFNITGHSVIDGVEAIVFTASIDSNAPQNMSINYFQSNIEKYKNNRVACHADQKEFEEYVYALQDELLAEIGGTKNGTEE